jgi:hypothetical protein
MLELADSVIAAQRPRIHRRPSRTPAAIRRRPLTRAEISRRARQRANDGDVVFQIRANRDAAILMLLEGGWLTEQQALDRRKVNAALSELFRFLLLHHQDMLRHP